MLKPTLCFELFCRIIQFCGIPLYKDIHYNAKNLTGLIKFELDNQWYQITIEPVKQGELEKIEFEALMKSLEN